MCRSPIRSTASRPASVSRISRTAARSASRSVRERLSMAEAKEAKAGKKPKADKAPAAVAGRPKSGADSEPRLQQFYREVVVPKLKEQFGYKNAHAIPRIEKIVLNMGVGEATGDTKKVQLAAD